MQAVEIRRMTVNRIIVAAAVAGTVVAGSIGLVINDALDDRSKLSIPVQRANQPFDVEFMEQNTQLPEVSVDRRSSAMDRADFLFGEKTTQLPGGVGNRTDPAYVMRAQDDVVLLPSDAAAALLPAGSDAVESVYVMRAHDDIAWPTSAADDTNAVKSSYVMRAQDDIVVPMGGADTALLAPEDRSGIRGANF